MAQYLNFEGTKIIANKIKEVDKKTNNKLDKSGGTVTGTLNLNNGGELRKTNDGTTGSILVGYDKVVIRGSNKDLTITNTEFSFAGNKIYHAGNKPTKADVGLNNVDNTSDLNKPISTATQNALNGKANSNHTHNKSQITDMPTKLSQFTNDAGFIRQSDVDTSQNHIHSNKNIIDQITQTLLDNWNKAFTHISDIVKHITATERTNWNSAFTHISDAVKHITSAERTLWNTVSNKLDKTGGTVTGKTIFNQGISVKNINGGSGTSGYMHIAQIKIGSANRDQPIIFNIQQRGRYGAIIVKFPNASSADPTLQYINKVGNINAYIHKVATSTWNLYVQKSEAYDSIDIIGFNKGEYMNNVTVTWQNATVTSLPSGYITAANATIDMNVSNAVKLQTARNVNGVAFDGTKDITVYDNTKLLIKDISVATDFNTLTDNCLYYINAHNSPNSPMGSSFGTLFCSAKGTKYQIAIPDNNNAIYRRTWNGTAWGAWTNLISKGAVGLGNVDNTSDANKPISTATQNALNGKANTNHTHNYAGSSSAGGAANSAVKLATARNIALTGDVIGNGNFDGSGNLSINTTSRKIALVGSDAENSNGWYKVASQTCSGFGDTNITFMVTSTYAHYSFGILQLQIRADNTNISCKRLSWLARTGFDVNHYIVVVNGMTWTLYAYQPNGRYGRLAFEILSMSNINDKNMSWALNFANNYTKETTTPTATVKSSDGSTVANAITATKVGSGFTASGTPSTNEKTNLVGMINEVFQNASNGKSSIATAITSKGVSAASSETFDSLANKIKQISTGTNTDDATATAGQILLGATAYVKGSKITGTMPRRTEFMIIDPIDPEYNTPVDSFDIAAVDISAVGLCGRLTVTLDKTEYIDKGVRTYIKNLVPQYIKSGVKIGGDNGMVGTFTNDATAQTGHILSGQTAYVKGSKITGTMPNKAGVTSTISTLNDATGNVGSGVTAITDLISGGDSATRVTFTPERGYYDGTTSKINLRLWGITAGNIRAGQKVGYTNGGAFTGTFTSDATAQTGHMLSGATAYVNGNKITGSIPYMNGTWGDQWETREISRGQYSYNNGGMYAYMKVPANHYINGINWIASYQPDLWEGNIVSGKNIFGVQGSAPNFQMLTGVSQLGAIGKPEGRTSSSKFYRVINFDAFPFRPNILMLYNPGELYPQMTYFNINDISYNMSYKDHRNFSNAATTYNYHENSDRNTAYIYYGASSQADTKVYNWIAIKL